MIPKCPINNVGIRHPVICSDGSIYEKKCLDSWLKLKLTSPVNRNFIELINCCELTEKCLNES